MPLLCRMTRRSFLQILREGIEEAASRNPDCITILTNATGSRITQTGNGLLRVGSDTLHSLRLAGATDPHVCLDFGLANSHLCFCVHIELSKQINNE